MKTWQIVVLVAVVGVLLLLLFFWMRNQSTTSNTNANANANMNANANTNTSQYTYASADQAVEAGMAYLENGETEKAIEAFNQAVAMDPSLADAYFQLGVAYALQESANAASPTPAPAPPPTALADLPPVEASPLSCPSTAHTLPPEA